MTQDEQSAARLADRGLEWLWCDFAEEDGYPASASIAREALHDRDRFQRERDYWREECIKLTGEALA